MSNKKNPLKLNALQLRSLTVLQVLAQIGGYATQGPGPDEVTISRFPPPHGDHIHLGDFVIMGKDASGLYNQAVWNALGRKGLARPDWPQGITLTAEGRNYDTGLVDQIAHRATH